MGSIAELLEHLTANAEVATFLTAGFGPSILRHSEISGAADEAVLNKED
jgi:hypothetical protein